MKRARTATPEPSSLAEEQSPSPFRPFVSVVVPVRNRSALIGRCIDALLMQTYPGALTQIIVVDNGSSDDTREIVSRYPVTLLEERDITTSYAARNRGISHAQGEIIALLDSDCIASPDWLEQLVLPFADETIGGVMGAIEDHAPSTLCEELTARVKPFARPDRGGLKTLLTANVAVRRCAWAEAGFFDERLPTAGDVDFGWRMQRMLGLQLVEVPGARVQHVHRSTLRGVFAQYHRYGFSEVLLSTLYRGSSFAETPSHQLLRMGDQLRAIASNLLSFAVRSARSLTQRVDRPYLLWPVFLMTIEAGNLTGKLRALAKTRIYRRNPFPNSRPINRWVHEASSLRHRRLSEPLAT